MRTTQVSYRKHQVDINASFSYLPERVGLQHSRLNVVKHPLDQPSFPQKDSRWSESLNRSAAIVRPHCLNCISDGLGGKSEVATNRAFCLDHGMSVRRNRACRWQSRRLRVADALTSGILGCPCWMWAAHTRTVRRRYDTPRRAQRAIVLAPTSLRLAQRVKLAARGHFFTAGDQQWPRSTNAPGRWCYT